MLNWCHKMPPSPNNDGLFLFLLLALGKRELSHLSPAEKPAPVTIKHKNIVEIIL